MLLWLRLRFLLAMKKLSKKKPGIALGTNQEDWGLEIKLATELDYMRAKSVAGDHNLLDDSDASEKKWRHLQHAFRSTCKDPVQRHPRASQIETPELSAPAFWLMS